MKVFFRIVMGLGGATALGFCVAFAFQEMVERATRERLAEARDAAPEESPVTLAEPGLGSDPFAVRAAARRAEARVLAADEISLADALLATPAAEGRFLLEANLAELEPEALEAQFVELMARDLEDGRAIEYAGRILQELAERAPELGVAALSALAPAEKEALAASLARGWVVSDAESAFDWIETAWVDLDGDYIDRELQNQLYRTAVDTLMTQLAAFDEAAARVDALLDPGLRAQLVELVARRVVSDGPEKALERMRVSTSEAMDSSILDAVAAEWSARDPAGAMEWSLGNQADVSARAARSVAKQLLLNGQRDSLGAFHGGLEAPAKKDSVAAEAARLLARREPVRSADWILAIEDASRKFAAVQDALYEIGYERFSDSVGYIDFVYRPEEPERASTVFATLKDWSAVDPASVEAYIESGRSGLAPELSREILGVVETM